MSEDTHANRVFWNRISASYQEAHASQLDERELAWGLWAIPEAEIQALGDVSGADVLELGCGGAQWSLFLRQRDVRAIGMDLSEQQLKRGRELADERAVTLPLVHADATCLPFADASFDVVFCDHGAMSFADPHMTVPEVARVVRPNGRFVFNTLSPLAHVCYAKVEDTFRDRLCNDYFEMFRFESDGSVAFQLSYGDWLRLFRSHGLVVEDLIELRPGPNASTTYSGYPLTWARRWPMECLWRLRLEA